MLRMDAEVRMMRNATLHRERASNPTSTPRRVVTGGLIGALPGLLLIGIPVLLAALDVISADQSQIGFLGVPLTVLGILVGSVLGAGRECSGSVVVGLVLGLLLGLIAVGVLAANRVLPGLSLILVPAAMIGGAAVGALRSGRRHTS